MHGRVVDRLRRALGAEIRGPESSAERSGGGDRTGRVPDATGGRDAPIGDRV